MNKLQWLTIQPEEVRSPANSSSPQSILCGRDKSLTHRAIMFAAMADGISVIHDALLGEDCLSTINCFAALGVETEIDHITHTVTVKSKGVKGFKSPDQALDCGNSGTTARLLAGLFSAIPGFTCTLIGDESLSKRPMIRVVGPLLKMGATITGPDQANFLPLTITGTKINICDHMIDKASAQIKSALLLACTQSDGCMTITLPAGARDHTEIMLRNFQGDCQSQKSNGMEKVRFCGPWQSKPINARVPVDPSSAAFFTIYGMLRPPSSKLTLPQVLNNDTRTGFLKVLNRMSSAVTIQESSQKIDFLEPVMNLHVEGGLPLLATDISEAEVPTLVDEIPILAVAAGFAKGQSRFYGLSELRVKESDRLMKTAELLQKAGIKAQIIGDDLLIEGGADKVRSFQYDPLGDHRLAMAAAILAKKADRPCQILGPKCVEVSFPDFFEKLDLISQGPTQE